MTGAYIPGRFQPSAVGIFHIIDNDNNDYDNSDYIDENEFDDEMRCRRKLDLEIDPLG